MRCHGCPCVAIRLLKHEWNKRGIHTQFDQHGGTTPGAFSRQFGHRDAANRNA
jgi:hypothetical protein